MKINFLLHYPSSKMLLFWMNRTKENFSWKFSPMFLVVDIKTSSFLFARGPAYSYFVQTYFFNYLWTLLGYSQFTFSLIEFAEVFLLYIIIRLYFILLVKAFFLLSQLHYYIKNSLDGFVDCSCQLYKTVSCSMRKHWIVIELIIIVLTQSVFLLSWQTVPNLSRV